MKNNLIEIAYFERYGENGVATSRIPSPREERYLVLRLRLDTAKFIRSTSTKPSIPEPRRGL